MHILIKISGDLITNRKAIAFIGNRAVMPDNPRIMVIAGAGSLITKYQKREKIKVEFEDGRRIHRSEESRVVALWALDTMRMQVNRKLAKYYPKAKHIIHVQMPCETINGQICHFNADEYLILLAPNFDDAYCLTKKGRVKKFPSAITVVKF